MGKFSSVLPLLKVCCIAFTMMMNCCEAAVRGDDLGPDITVGNDLDGAQFRTYVRLQLSENFYSVIDTYEGAGLMIETNDAAGRPVFFATVMFETARGESNNPSMHFSYNSMVNVKYYTGAGYEPLRENIKDKELEVERMTASISKRGGSINLYKEALRSCYAQFELPIPKSLIGIIRFFREMRVEEGNSYRFPYYTLTGYSFYHDSVNCIGFCLRALDKMGFSATGPLAVYLNHEYSGKDKGFFERIGGWFKTRTPRTSVRNLTLEYCLRNLFTNISYEYSKEVHNIYKEITSQDNQILRIEEVMGNGNVRDVTNVAGIQDTVAQGRVIGERAATRVPGEYSKEVHNIYKEITSQDNQILRIEEVMGNGNVRDVTNVAGIQDRIAQGRVIRVRTVTARVASLDPTIAGMRLITTLDGMSRRNLWKSGDDINPFLNDRKCVYIKPLFERFGEDNVAEVNVLLPDRFRP